MFYIELFTVISLGLVFGSFSTALAHRVPQKLPWGAVRSACPSCGAALNFFDLIPVVLWCVFRAKCRHCSSKISCRYPLIELVSVFLCLMIYFVYGFTIESLIFIAAVPILISLFVIDLEYMILPNQLILILVFFGILRLFYFSISGGSLQLEPLLVPYLLGFVIYAALPWFLGAVLSRVTGKECLGFGDVKFFAASGLWLGLGALPYFMIVAGSVAVLFSLIWRAVTKREVFPFGPALILSFYALLLFQGSFSL